MKNIGKLLNRNNGSKTGWKLLLQKILIKLVSTKNVANIYRWQPKEYQPPVNIEPPAKIVKTNFIHLLNMKLLYPQEAKTCKIIQC